MPWRTQARFSNRSVRVTYWKAVVPELLQRGSQSLVEDELLDEHRGLQQRVGLLRMLGEILIEVAEEACVECRICDLDDPGRVLGYGVVGEVCVRGPNLMSGYRGRPEESASALRDGWLYTGDIGLMDDDGYLTLSIHETLETDPELHRAIEQALRRKRLTVRPPADLDPALLTARFHDGARAKVFTFVAKPDHAQYYRAESPEHAAALVRQGRGACGTALDYLRNVIRHLDEIGIAEGPLHRVLKAAEADDGNQS